MGLHTSILPNRTVQPDLLFSRIQYYFIILRPLHNFLRSVGWPFFKLKNGFSAINWAHTVTLSLPKAADTAFQAHLSLASRHEDCFFQVEGHGIEQKFQLDLGDSHVARPEESISPFERAEGTFHLCPDTADETVCRFLVGAERSVAGGLVHDAVRKPSGLEHMPVQLAAVPLVRIDATSWHRVDFV
nr:hypothetical protein [Solidesulfovibrio aerotolerans]